MAALDDLAGRTLQSRYEIAFTLDRGHLRTLGGTGHPGSAARGMASGGSDDGSGDAASDSETSAGTGGASSDTARDDEDLTVLPGNGTRHGGAVAGSTVLSEADVANMLTHCFAALRESCEYVRVVPHGLLFGSLELTVRAAALLLRNAATRVHDYDRGVAQRAKDAVVAAATTLAHVATGKAWKRRYFSAGGSHHAGSQHDAWAMRHLCDDLGRPFGLYTGQHFEFMPSAVPRLSRQLTPTDRANLAIPGLVMRGTSF
jgi:hypothetical protein